MYLGEAVYLTQARETFRLGLDALLPLAVYLAVPLAAAAAGVLNLALGALVTASAALFVFGEGSILPPAPRLAAMAAAALAVPLGAWLVRRRFRPAPATATRLWVVAWLLSIALTRLPRDLFLDAYNFRWRDAGLRLAAALGIAALAALWWWLMRLAERPRAALALGAGLPAVVAFALSGLGAARAPEGQPRGDIYYVVLDALRFDYTSLPPNGGDATPALAGLAARGVSFPDAHSPSTATEFSLPRLLGLAAEGPSGPRTRWTALDPAFDASLPGRLRAAGYRLHLLSDYAANELHGFDVYRWDTVAARPARAFRLWSLAPALAAILRGEEHALGFVAGDKFPFDARGAAGALDDRLAAADGPGFYLIHLAVPHAPYNLAPYRAKSLPAPPEDEARALFRKFERLQGGADPATTERLRALYALAVRAADEQVAAILEVAERRGRLADALVVVTSDHGEPLGEHGMFGHGRTLYAEGHHVPLVLAGPGLPAGAVPPAAVSNADLPATILEWAGVEPAGPASLRDVATGAAPPRPVVVWHPRGVVVQRDGRRLLWTAERHLLDRPASWNHRAELELYDVVADPGETKDLFPAGAPPALLDELAANPAIPEGTRRRP
jgi:arylsulfatase A-like enzyme